MQLKLLSFILSFSMRLQFMSNSRINASPRKKNYLITLLIIYPFETVNPFRKGKAQKDFSFYKRFLEELKNFENFGATLEDMMLCVFQYP